MIEISVVVPIYKGKKYLDYLTDIFKKNFDRFNEIYNMPCEAIFINDCPEEKIELQEISENFVVYNLKENRGIHGARVFGYHKAKGKYIIFLDQDDKISENYLVSQRQNIGIADAVVCNGYRERLCIKGKRTIYAKKEQMNKATCLNNYIIEGNQIISPGQVLIKKEAIPGLWLNEIIKNNGADDYFLWILMLSKGCNFITNQCQLYTHVENGSNTSNEFEMMKYSLIEVLKILKKNKILSEKERNEIYTKYCFNNSGKILEIVKIYDYWMYLNKRGKTIETYCLAKNYHNIAIYGLNYIGNRLYDDLYDTSIKVVFGIDSAANSIEYEIPVFEMEDPVLIQKINEIDVIIVTAVTSYENILYKLKKISHKPVVHIKSIFVEMIGC